MSAALRRPDPSPLDWGSSVVLSSGERTDFKGFTRIVVRDSASAFSYDEYMLGIGSLGWT